MRFLTTLFFLAGLPLFLFAQDLYFPPLEGSEWATRTPLEAGMDPDSVAALTQFLADNNTKGFLLLQDGRIVIEAYFDSFTQDSIWYWASAGKSLMGMLLGLAQEDGYLSIEDPAADYLGSGWTSCPPGGEEAVLLRHQLSMSSGFDDSVEPTGSADNCFTPDCFICMVEPGTRWAYHNSAYRILQNVLEVATGINKNPYTRQRLGNRIGMEGFWFNYVFFSTPRDMARFGLLTLAQGVWAGDTILRDTGYFEAMLESSQPANPAYGYLWWLNGKSFYQLPGFQVDLPGSLVPEAPADMVAALGRDDQKIYVVPSHNLVVVRMGESAGGISPSASSFDNQLWQRLNGLWLTTSLSGDLASASALRAFPNPASTYIQMQLPEPEGMIELWDELGRLVRQQAITDANPKLSILDLPRGWYVLRWYNGKNTLQQKVLLH